MRVRSFITLALSLMVNAVLFGTGAVIVLSIPALRDHMAYLLPAVIIVSLVLTPFIAWKIAPRMRARFWYPRRYRLLKHTDTTEGHERPAK